MGIYFKKRCPETRSNSGLFKTFYEKQQFIQKTAFKKHIEKLEHFLCPLHMFQRGSDVR